MICEDVVDDLAQEGGTAVAFLFRAPGSVMSSSVATHPPWANGLQTA